MRVVLWTLIVIWFFHLAVGAGAGFAAYRLWSERRNQFIKYVLIALHATMLGALGSIVLLFLSKGVRLTWKFSIAMFAFALVQDLVVLPLILFVIRGPKASE